MTEKALENIARELPDPEAAERFIGQLKDRYSFQATRLLKQEGLLSDILTLVSFSPLFSTTLLQNPDYILWLGRKRKDSQVRDKEELLESLARFSMTNTQIEPQELLARFRRRELLRIYLRDIRRLGTIAEVTEEISHLADAILEFALRLARQELDNRFGSPQETDEKGRTAQAKFCIVALGKLGSNELNYSSDIDLLFLYSSDGSTTGIGSRGVTSNREYFIKLSEFIVKLVGHEGGAYRVDLRLRPHGRVGALAVSLGEAVNYYQINAQAWERQTLIRSRSSAGDSEIFRSFFENVETYVFSETETVENALQNVKLSKDKINREHTTSAGFNVKLGEGGIREIEFIAQALQLAYGGGDKWLRAPHTLISLSRLADRKLLSEKELSELYDAYDFLRRLEHRLQMENGLQTHIVPEDREKRHILAKRMVLQSLEEFETTLLSHTQNVNRVFVRVFGDSLKNEKIHQTTDPIRENINAVLVKSIEKSDEEIHLTEERMESLSDFSQLSPYFSQTIASNPNLLITLPKLEDNFRERDYEAELRSEVAVAEIFAQEIGNLRKHWSKSIIEIAFFDVFDKISRRESKTAQTRLAEASLNIAFEITKREMARKFGDIPELNLAILGLGKLGGRGMDYGSDMDLVLVYDDEKALPVADLSHAEFYGRAVEILVNALSSFTREGNLYRVDLRLRPDGKNGATSLSKTAFLSYFTNRAAIWELLAYVKIRGVSGDISLALATENEVRKVIHEKARNIDKQELASETRRVRERLEKEKSDVKNRSGVNIKFGAGGMLDVYFAMRYLQLRDVVPDEAYDRSTEFMLKKLFENGSMNDETFVQLRDGYEFLSRLDHALRLTIGRSNNLPGNLEVLSNRLNNHDLLEQLTIHRLNIRDAFEKILSNPHTR